MRVTVKPSRCGLALLLLALGSASGRAFADDPTPEAERALQRGVELRRLGKDAEALEAFKQAYALERSPRAAAQIALARQALGDWTQAERDLQDVLGAGEDPWIARYRGALEQALATVRAHLGSLQVETNVKEGVLSVGDGPSYALPLKEPIRVIAGTTRIEVRSEGYRPEQRSVGIDPGTTLRVAVVLTRESPPDANVEVEPVHPMSSGEPRHASSSAAAVYGAFGAAGLLAGAGVIAWRVHENAAAIYNDDGRCRVAPLTRAERCGGWAQEANVALGLEVAAFAGTAVAAALGGWLLWRRDAHSTFATLWCIPWAGTGLWCERRF